MQLFIDDMEVELMKHRWLVAFVNCDREDDELASLEMTVRAANAHEAINVATRRLMVKDEFVIRDFAIINVLDLDA